MKTRRCKVLAELLAARTSERQTAELQIRAALLTHGTRVGMPETVRLG